MNRKADTECKVNFPSADALPVFIHHQQAVMTTDLLATMYGVEEKRVRDNFKRNQDRFISGKHYFKVEGADLKGFKQAADEILDDPHYTPVRGVVRPDPKSPSLLLWTGRGAARHAKLIQTDQAWDVFEMLEDSYFERSEVGDINGMGLTQKEHQTIDVELRRSIEAYVRLNDSSLKSILLHRIVRDCRRLGIPIPKAVTHAQIEFDGMDS